MRLNICLLRRSQIKNHSRNFSVILIDPPSESRERNDRDEFRQIREDYNREILPTKIDRTIYTIYVRDSPLSSAVFSTSMRGCMSANCARSKSSRDSRLHLIDISTGVPPRAIKLDVAALEKLISIFTFGAHS